MAAFADVLFEILRSAPALAPLIIACLMAILTNQLELVFARSLIQCKSQSHASAGFSGSAYCADRAYTIKEGQILFAAGQSVESYSKILVLLLSTKLCDAYGRRPVIIGGLTLVAASALSFLLACFIQSYSSGLFVLGQGLQAAIAPEILIPLVAADLAAQQDTEAGSKDCLGIPNIVMMWCGSTSLMLAMVIQQLYMTDYSAVWGGVFFMYLWALKFTMEQTPETWKRGVEICTGPEERAVEKGIGDTVTDELKEYAHLVISDSTFRMWLLAFIFLCLGEGIMSPPSFSLPMSMASANFGWDAGLVSLTVAPAFVIASNSMHIVPSVLERFGYRKGCFYALCAMYCAQLLTWTWPLHWSCMFGNVYVGCLFSGFIGIKNACEAKVFKHQVAQFVAMSSILMNGVNIVAAPMYANILDPKATTYFGKAAPCLLSILFKVIHIVLMFLPCTGIWSQMGKACDEIEDDHKEMRMKHAAAKEKADKRKATNSENGMKSHKEEAEKDESEEESEKGSLRRRRGQIDGDENLRNNVREEREPADKEGRGRKEGREPADKEEDATSKEVRKKV